MSNEKITKKVLAKAAEEGDDAFLAGETLAANPYDEKKNHDLWITWADGFLDTKNEYDKL